MSNVNDFFDLLSDPAALTSFGVLVAFLLVWKVFMPLLRPKRMSVHTGVEAQKNSEYSTAWTPEDQKRNERIHTFMAIKSASVKTLCLIGLIGLAVWTFVPTDTVEFVVRFWQPGLLLFLGLVGFVMAKRGINTHNSWNDIPYLFSLVLFIGGTVASGVLFFRILF
jgi:hypothetical protein